MWKKTKKAMMLCIAALSVAAATVTGTLAYMESGAKNAISEGMVQIDQREYERVAKGETALQLFTQDKPLYPACGQAVADVPMSWNTVGADSSSLLYGSQLSNEIDKFVFIENTGSQDAYVRTWFAFEQGSYRGELLKEVIRLNVNDTDWRFGEPKPDVTIRGNVYTVVYADYKGALPIGETSAPSLLQVYMDSSADCEDVLAIDGNENGRYEILVTSQAAGLDDLDTLFAEHPFADADAPRYVDSFAELEAAVESGSDIELGSNIAVEQTITVPAGKEVDIDGNNFTLTRGDNFTGTMFQAEDQSTLTMQNLTVDGGGKDGVVATGNLIASDYDATIILNGDAVLQNNNGKGAILFSKTYAGTLVLNGAQILNNTSDGGGAVYGCNAITVNDGSVVSGNHSTGYGGAFRMVRGTLTVNGGQITNNTSVREGGAMYAYQDCDFVFNGGEIAYNTTQNAGGVLYSGYNAEITVSGTQMHHNSAVESGGAIRLVSGSYLTMTGGAMYENTAGSDGGAIYGWNSGAAILGGSITDNSSANGVGGMYLNNKNYNLEGSATIKDNMTTSTNTETNYNK